MAINVSVYKNLPYDPTRDLVPIALVAGVPFILVVNPALPVKSLRRSRGLCEDAAAGADLCLERRRRRRASVRRTARRRARHQARARALQGARAGAQRHHGRPRADDVRRLRHRAAAGAGRQAARARRFDRAARRPGAGNPGARRGRAEGLRRVVLADDDRAGEDPARHPQSAEHGDARDRCRAGGAEGFLRPRPDPARRAARRQELQAYVKSEIVRWGDVVKRAGVAATQ